MKQPLNFDWSFIDGFENTYLKKLDSEKIKTVNIPHNPVEIPYNYFSEQIYQKVYTYEKFFDVIDYSKKVYILKFDGFMLKADIYLNDKHLGLFVSGYLPVEIDVSDIIKERNNRLVVVLDSREDNNYPPFGFTIDYLTFSGIYREVSLLSYEDTYLKDFYIHADKNGHVKIIYEKVGNSDIKVKHSIFLKGEPLLEFEGDECLIENPKVWDLDSPTLYTLITEVNIDGKVEEYTNHFAFRNAEFRKDGFYLNDKKVKLIGLNRHQGYPYMGYAASKALQEDDAVLLKKTGVNVVRTSHYPQSEHFLNKCDEIGLLVVDEIPGWQHIGSSEIWKENCIENTRRMVLKERNHPSIIAYGVRIDESVDDHDLYSKTNQIAHSLDQYRQTIGVRNFKDSELLEDIYGYNDFICYSLKQGLEPSKNIKHGDKPYLVTEYMGHMDPVKPTSDIQKKIEVALKHAKVINDNMKYDDIAGAIGWCFVDYHTHVDFGSGDHICPHGVFDMYRNPKLTSYIYAAQQEKEPVLEVLSNMKPGDVPAAIFSDIYVVTNCDYVELFNNGQFVKRFYPESKTFPNMKHPPIVIDDIVGDTFKEGKFPPKHQKKIANRLSFAAIYGFGALDLKTKLYLAYIMKKYNVSYTDLVHYWNEYVGTWGGKAKVFEFKGYKDGQVVKTISRGPSTTFHYDFIISKNVLVNEETYDTLSISIKHLDEHNALQHYSQRIVEVETEGLIDIVGPKIQNLIGGQLTLYFRSKSDKVMNNRGGLIKIKIDNIVKEFKVEIKHGRENR